MRANPVVVAATDELAVRIAPHLRLADCREIREGVDVLALIRTQLAGSSHAWTWILDGEPACMFGIVPRTLIGDTGVVWVLTTEAIRRDRRTFWLGSKMVLACMLDIYPRLEAFVDARFDASVAWLTRLGFAMDAPRDRLGVPFRYCTKVR